MMLMASNGHLWMKRVSCSSRKAESRPHALLRADTATDAELLRDERDLGRRRDLDTKLACTSRRPVSGGARRKAGGKESAPIRTTGHDFLHSCRHFFGYDRTRARVSYLHFGTRSIGTRSKAVRSTLHLHTTRRSGVSNLVQLSSTRTGAAHRSGLTNAILVNFSLIVAGLGGASRLREREGKKGRAVRRGRCASQPQDRMQGCLAFCLAVVLSLWPHSGSASAA